MNHRVPPHSNDAERGVVGVLLVRPDLLAEILDIGLRAADFYSPKWGAAFAAIVELAETGEPIDSLTLDEALGAHDGPRPEASELIGSMADVPSLGHAVTYATRVRDYAKQRRIMAAATEVLERGYDPATKTDLDGYADWVEATMLAETRQESAREAPGLLVDAVDAALDELSARSAGERRGVPSGLADLDRMTGGFRSGQLVVVGARPSVGKSALAFGIGIHVAGHIGSVLFVSAEMGRIELGTRALAGGGVASDRLLSGRLDALDHERLRRRRDHMASLPLLIDDSPGITLAAIRAKARRQLSKGLVLVVVDYLQLVVGEGRRERRELEVAEVSRGLKSLARELEVPVVAVAQLNRGLELRANKRPVLADLRDSGQLEQDADVVLFLHRPAVYDLEADPGAAELIVAKHRNGPTGSVHLTWLPHRMAFVDAARTGVDF